MKTDSINQWATLGANIGVIAGILLLAYELNQNNQLLAAEARALLMLNRAEIELTNATNIELMRLRTNTSTIENLTDEEVLRLDYIARHNLTKWEWEFDQYKSGFLDSIPVQGWIYSFKIFSHQRGSWERVKNTYTPDFVIFMEENVISQL